jgi:hypothetical protein
MSLSFTFPGSIQTCPQRGQAATNPSLCRANRHAELRSYLAMSATIDISQDEARALLGVEPRQLASQRAFLRETRCCIPAAVEDRRQNSIVHPRAGEAALIALLGAIAYNAVNPE